MTTQVLAAGAALRPDPAPGACERRWRISLNSTFSPSAFRRDSVPRALSKARERSSLGCSSRLPLAIEAATASAAHRTRSRRP